MRFDRLLADLELARDVLILFACRDHGEDRALPLAELTDRTLRDSRNEDDIGTVRRGEIHCFAAVRRRRHDLNVDRGREELFESPPHDRVILGKQDTDAARVGAHRTGTCISTVVPPPGRESTVSCPPASTARSLRMRKPKWRRIESVSSSAPGAKPRPSSVTVRRAE